MISGTATVLRGDARSLPLPDDSVDLVVTSPPYWALRSYTDGGHHYDGQIGAEPTPTEYVDNLLDCTREWIRVLRPTGSIFVNLGDVYASRATPEVSGSSDGALGRGARPGRRSCAGTGVRTKSLYGLPWRYAIGCIDQLGLILRAEMVWKKPTAMPESVTDRVHRTHETWLHFTTRPRYYAAIDEIREPSDPGNIRPSDRRGAVSGKDQRRREAGNGTIGHPGRPLEFNPLGKLPGSVWEIPTEPLVVPEHLGVEHYAAFPTAWPKRLILGWSPTAYCTACGEPRRPVPAALALDLSRPQARRAQQLAARAGLTDDHLDALVSVGLSDTGRDAATQAGTGKNSPEVYERAAVARAALGSYAREYLMRRPAGITHVCACSDTTAPIRLALVLDPFGGTGTTALVAKALGRHGITVDRSADYCRIAQWRTCDPGQLAKVLGLPKPREELEGQMSLLDLDPAS